MATHPKKPRSEPPPPDLPMPQRRTFTPLRQQAAPPRRPGSDHSHIPSIAAGLPRQHRNPI